jgi:copper transport protein
MPASPSPTARLRRASTRGLAALAVLVLVLVTGTGVASAHASLVSTNPVDGQSVPTPPQLVTATFSEGVSVESGGGLSVRNRAGDQVDEGNSSAQANTLQVTLPNDLPDGTYIATYRVVSADGHPVSGSWTFGIGTGPVDLSAPVSTGDAPWELAGAIARFVAYLSALLAAGVAFFLAFLHDQRADRWKLVPVVRVAAIVGLFAVVATIIVQAALLTGDGISAATNGNVLRSVLTDRLGWSCAVLLIGLAAVHLSTDTNKLIVAQILAFYGGLAVTVSFALYGHDTEAPNRWLVIGSDAVHVTAAAVWLGGLAGLFLVLRRRAPHPVRSTATIVSRFSNVAAVSVLFLAAAGLAMAWVEVGSLSGLWSTTYGRLVLVKVAITLGVVVMAAYNRFRLIPAITEGAATDPVDDEPADEVVTIPPSSAASAGPAHDTGVGVATTTIEPGSDTLAGSLDDEDDEPTEAELQSWRWTELRRTVGYEALALVAALAFTAVLVNTTPARTVIENQPKVVNLTDSTESGEVNLVVTPARAGTNTMHVQYSDPAGKPLDVADTLTVEMSLPDKQIGPLTRQVVKISPGHYVLEGDEMSIGGDWTVTLAVRTSDFTEERTSFVIPIAK